MKTQTYSLFYSIPILFLCFALPAFSNTHRVGHGGGYNFNSITDALTAAAPGDLILVADGNYTAATGERFPLRLPRNIEIHRENSSSLPHIIGDQNSCVIYAQGLSSYNTVLNGFWISNGIGLWTRPPRSLAIGRYGGAVYLEDANIVISNCVLSNSIAEEGGGIYSVLGKPHLISCVVQNNTAERTSGIAAAGGGIICRNGSMLLSDCSIVANTADRGAGVFSFYGEIEASYCVISWNTAHDFGAGLYVQYCSPIIESCTFSYNNAAWRGGGIYCSYGCQVNVVNCLIQANQAQKGGGGIYCESGTPTLTHCTISRNTTDIIGGGVSTTGVAMPTLTNCIIWWNTDDVYDPSGTGFFDHCNIGDGDYIGINNNIALPASFVNMSAGNFNLASDSPCIDRGRDVGLPFSGTAPDMGAFESTYLGPLPAPQQCNDIVGPSGTYTKLTEALITCPPGSNLYLEPGDYSVATGEELPFIVYGITIHPLTIGSVVNLKGNGSKQVLVTGFADTSVPFTIELLNILDGSAFLGGGVRVLGSHPQFLNCTIANNEATEEGGGIYCQKSEAEFINTVIHDNYAYHGGGVSCFYLGQTTFTNCIVWQNSAYENGGGFIINNTATQITNCTITGNTGMSGEGAYIERYSNAVILNSILWGNGNEDIRDNAVATSITYCDIGQSMTGAGNISADPLFVDAVNGDFHLTGSSPCLDVGQNIGAPAIDIDGDVRPDPVALIVDIGADEYSRTELTATPTATVTLTPTYTPNCCPTTSPTLTPSPTATSSPTVTPTPTPTWTPTTSPTETPSPSPTLSPTATVTPIPTYTATATASPTIVPSATPSLTPTTTPTWTETASPTNTMTGTPSPTPSMTPSPTLTPTSSPSSSPTPTLTPTQSPTDSPTATLTGTSTSSPTTTPTTTPTSTPSSTATPTPTPSDTPTSTPTGTITGTPTVTATPSLTPTNQPTSTPSTTPTQSPTLTPSASPSLTPSATPTHSPTATRTATLIPTSTPTSTDSPTPTLTATPTDYPTPSPTFPPNPPYTDEHDPVRWEINVPVTKPITVHIKDDEEGVDLNTVEVYVEYNLVSYDWYDINAPWDYLLVYQPTTTWPSGSQVKIEIHGADLARPAHWMVPDFYTVSFGHVTTPTPSPTETPVVKPIILIAGYLDTNLFQQYQGEWKLWAYSDGGCDKIELFYQSAPTGVVLTQGAAQEWLYTIPIPTGAPQDRFLFELYPEHQGWSGDLWPYLTVAP